MKCLITGGSGYFGGLLKRTLLKKGHACVNIDLDEDVDSHPNLKSIVGNVADESLICNTIKAEGPFDCVYHAAAQLQLTHQSKSIFYDTNIQSTRYLAENCVKYGIPNLVFISSNCVYGKVNGIDISENAQLEPFEEYGKTKVASEKILAEYSDILNTIIFRPPTIIGKGRLGILSLVFDFIRENRKIWLIGSGENRYQFIYGDDLVAACILAATYKKSNVFNIGCHAVPTLNELFLGVIREAKSQSKIYHLPQAFFIPAMKLCFKLGISPLGPYQYNMIANTYIGDISNIRNELGWTPSKSNIEMLTEGYYHYINYYDEIHKNAALSGHRKAGKAGIINLIKLLS